METASINSLQLVGNRECTETAPRRNNDPMMADETANTSEDNARPYATESPEHQRVSDIDPGSTWVDPGSTWVDQWLTAVDPLTPGSSNSRRKGGT